MEVIDGQWFMEGVDSTDPSCIHTSDGLLEVIEKVGFLPLFSNDVPGFSVENMTDPSCWWCGDPETDPWEWRSLYTTGQSMGGMTSFYLNLAYPDLFAASLFVGSQWDTSIMRPLESKSFFYIVSGGDSKASAGQSSLMEVFELDNASYSHATWSAQDDPGIQNSAVQKMLLEGNNANFITFTAGTTVPGGTATGGGAGEHMTSFDYAYKIEAVRDWLFAQHS